jgi:hypothetical protein
VFATDRLDVAEAVTGSALRNPGRANHRVLFAEKFSCVHGPSLSIGQAECVDPQVALSRLSRWNLQA